MFVVFWIQKEYQQDVTLCKHFSDMEMTKALEFAQLLRKDERMSFVCLCSENPNSVGKPGVADVSSDYNWKKRRI